MQLSRRLQLVAVAAVLCAASVAGHTPIINGTTQAGSYSTWQTALNIPTNLISLSVKRISGCGRPYFWLKYTGKKGDGLDVSAVTTGAAGFAGVRLSVAVFGPGLPKAKQFAFPTPKTDGALYLPGPASVTSCAFIERKEKRDGYSVVNKRCGLVSETTGVSYFPILDNAWKLPAAGTYYFVFFTQGQYTAWYSVATGSLGHSHAHLPKGVMPEVSPIGNGPKGLNFYNPKAKSACCRKGTKACPARKVFA